MSTKDELRTIMDALGISYNEQKLETAGKGCRTIHNAQAVIDKLSLWDKPPTIQKLLAYLNSYHEPMPDCFFCTPQQYQEQKPQRLIPILDHYRYRQRMDHLARNNANIEPYEFIVSIPKKAVSCPKCAGQPDSVRDAMQYFNAEEYNLTWLILFDYARYHLKMEVTPETFDTEYLVNFKIEPHLSEHHLAMLRRNYELTDADIKSAVSRLANSHTINQSELPF